MEAIEKNLHSILERIERAAKQSGRNSSDVRLTAVSKKQPIEKMEQYLEICTSKGLSAIFGENYVQEFREKKSHLTGTFESHLIGPLQRNKAKDAVELFDVIQSVHTIPVAEAISKEAKKVGKVQRVFIQINVSNDPAKAGFLLEDSEKSWNEIRLLDSIKLEGLMTITELYDEPERARNDYRRLFEFSKRLKETVGLKKVELSMGMSDDFEIAVEEGATLVRIGTALFGARG